MGRPETIIVPVSISGPLLHLKIMPGMHQSDVTDLAQRHPHFFG